MFYSILWFLVGFSLAVRSVPVESTTEPSTTENTTMSPPPCSRSDTNGGYLPNVIFPQCTASLAPESLRNMVIHGMACACDLSTRGVPKRDDYQYTPGLGAHKLHTRAATFNEARKVCNEEGGHLAVIDSLAEEQVLLDLFRAASTIRGAVNTDQAFIGTHDLYNEGDWVTILGDSLHRNGYTKWSDQWGGQPDNGGGVQHCGALLKSGGMDDVNCNIRFAFFCEIPAIQPAY
ncbi:hemolymph lipopolysaccharide-binding protein-like [Venturia canescens]|uniref:hemolymph lipopolysaccharide-binding protein-like n=1 Tax=Venturia canescens TaxID=32260 RepID=UPI001C9C239C|nr:hemolymph lipopolysaccharide-binding protein-like [Venturia canescens]